MRLHYRAQIFSGELPLSFCTELSSRWYAEALCTTTSAFPLTVKSSGRPVRLSLLRWAFVFRLKSVSDPMSSGLTMAVVSADPSTSDSAANRMRINLLAKGTGLVSERLFNFGKIEIIHPPSQTVGSINACAEASRRAVRRRGSDNLGPNARTAKRRIESQFR